MTVLPPICASSTPVMLGGLTINSVFMHKDGAWNVLNTQELWLPNANRGQNVVISKARGQRAYPYRTNQSEYSMQLVIDGVLDVDGDPYSNVWEGLEANVEYLYDNVFVPPAAPNSTYPAELEMPSGEIRAANVQAKHPQQLGASGSSIFIGTFTLIVPNGRFEPVAS